MNLNPVAVPADRRDVALATAVTGEISLRAAIARKTDSEPPHVVCAWCPDFTPDPTVTDVSHGLCPACEARLNAEIDTREASR